MVTMSRFELRSDARRRAARRLGLTHDDAPRSVALPSWTRFAASLALKLWPGFRRGLFAPVPAWEFWLAVGVIREVQERHSWCQARRASIGRPASSD